MTPRWPRESTSEEYFKLRAIRSKTHIRLLKILTPQPDAIKDILSCSLLEDICLMDAPPYKAMSYAWGLGVQLRTIWINGGRFEITASCHRVLSQMASHGDAENVWIDSICIDQESNAEKSDQVQLMGEIYRRASVVIGFLDTTGTDSELIRRAISHFEHCTPSADLTASDWYGIQVLAQTRYWGRLWIVQECLCARELQFMCADSILPASTLYRAVSHYVKQSQREANGSDSSSPPDEVYNMWTLLHSKLQGDDKFEFDHAVELFNELECSDPRDRIFGLSAIIKWPHDKPYRVDYHKSLQQVACEVAQYCHTPDGGRSLVRALSSDPTFRNMHFVELLNAGAFAEDISQIYNYYRTRSLVDLQFLGQASILAHRLQAVDSHSAQAVPLISTPSDRLDSAGRLLTRHGGCKAIAQLVEELEREFRLDGRSKLALVLDTLGKLDASNEMQRLALILKSGAEMTPAGMAYLQEMILGPNQSDLCVADIILPEDMELESTGRLHLALVLTHYCSSAADVENVVKECELDRLHLRDKIVFARGAMLRCSDGTQEVDVLRMLSYERSDRNPAKCEPLRCRHSTC